MGRVKLEIKRIENIQSRHITYAKRRNGLIKKAYELSVLCDIDIALVMFSPSGKLSHFACKKTRIEDVITRFANLPEHERAKSQTPKRHDNHDIPASRRLENHELLIKAVNKLNLESDMASNPSRNSVACVGPATLENLRIAIQKTQMQLQLAEDRLRIYEMDPKCLNSVQQAEQLEHLVEQALKRVQIRMQALENNPVVNYNPSHMQQLYAMQAQAGAVAGHQGSQQFIPWLLLREPQTNIHNLMDHANSGSILSMRDSHGTLEYSSNASLYSGLMAQGADLQLTTQPSQSDVRALSSLKAEQLYPFQQSILQDIEKVMDLDVGIHGYPNSKSEEDQVGQEMVRAFGSNDVLSSSSVLQSAYQTTAVASIASPSASQFHLGQQTMMSNVHGHHLLHPQQNEMMQQFEGYMANSHGETSHEDSSLQVHSQGLLSLGCNFNNN